MMLGARSRTEDEEVEEDTVLWLITYSDMTTLLLAFFLVMYSFTIMGETHSAELVDALKSVDRGAVQRAAAEESLEEAAQKIAREFSREQEQAYVESSEDEVTVVLPSGITFSSGEAALSEEARASLEKVALLLGRLPNAIRVEGHTDNVPIRGGAYVNNWHLSATRAQNVVRLLMEHGLDPRRLHVVGHGEAEPRESNASEEGRRRNRRIEIKLVR